MGLIILLLILLTSIFLKKPVEISILVPGIQSRPIWNELITDFEEENKDENITIKMVHTSDETNVVRDKYKNSNYDLVYMDIIWVSELAKEGRLVALSKMFSQEELKELEADFLPNDWKGSLYEQKPYRIPFHSDVGLLYYRKDLLKDGGYDEPPHTFDELMKMLKKMKMSEKLRNKKPELYIWQGMKYEGLVATFVEVLNSYGGYWIDIKRSDPDNVGLGEPPALSAVKFLHNTINKEISPKKVTTFTERETNDLFVHGKPVFLRSWIDFWTQGNNNLDSEIKNQFDFVSMRGVDPKNNNKVYLSCQGGWGLGISSNSEHQDEALKAIKFFTRVNTQRKYALRTGHMPSRRSLINDLQLVKRYTYYPRLLEISQNLIQQQRPLIANYSKVSEILQKHLSNVLNKPEMSSGDIQKEMEQAASETRVLLKEVLQK
ncbi:extracellular solute-binding protein [Nostoc sp.]|uniref:extracellular solute-binding protein n=1 Tax=Nostoc sp. TaxID=1180 RepID=UPI002FFCC275